MKYQHQDNFRKGPITYFTIKNLRKVFSSCINKVEFSALIDRHPKLSHPKDKHSALNRIEAKITIIPSWHPLSSLFTKPQNTKLENHKFTSRGSTHLTSPFVRLTVRQGSSDDVILRVLLLLLLLMLLRVQRNGNGRRGRSLCVPNRTSRSLIQRRRRQRLRGVDIFVVFPVGRSHHLLLLLPAAGLGVAPAVDVGRSPLRRLPDHRLIEAVVQTRLVRSQALLLLLRRRGHLHGHPLAVDGIGIPGNVHELHHRDGTLAVQPDLRRHRGLAIVRIRRGSRVVVGIVGQSSGFRRGVGVNRLAVIARHRLDGVDIAARPGDLNLLLLLLLLRRHYVVLVLMGLNQLLLGQLRVLLVQDALMLMRVLHRLLLDDPWYHLVMAVLTRALLVHDGVRVVSVLRRLMLHPAVDQRLWLLLLLGVVQAHVVVDDVVVGIGVVVVVGIGGGGGGGTGIIVAGERARVAAVGAGVVVGGVTGVVAGLEAVKARVAVVGALVHDGRDRGDRGPGAMVAVGTAVGRHDYVSSSAVGEGKKHEWTVITGRSGCFTAIALWRRRAFLSWARESSGCDGFWLLRGGVSSVNVGTFLGRL